MACTMVDEILDKYQIINSKENNRELVAMARALRIAIIIGLSAVVFLFKQPFLDKLFSKQTNPDYMLKSILLSGATGTGWVVWYLKTLKRYGDFFYVLLLTLTVGFCWYARLTAPEDIQLTAFCFLVSSLFRLAKDMMDEAKPESMSRNDREATAKPEFDKKSIEPNLNNEANI